MFRSTPQPVPGRNRITPSLQELDARINPVIITNGDLYTAARGSVLNVPAAQGVLANDYSTTDYGALLNVDSVATITATGTNRALPPDTITLNPDGSFVAVLPGQEFPDTITKITFTYRVSNLNSPNEIGFLGSATIDVTEPIATYIATGADAGGSPLVKVYATGTGELVRSFEAYESTFTGGVRVAVGDIDRDGIDDIITVPGMGGSATVKIFSGRDNGLIYSTTLFSPTFRGGAYVTVGDVDADGEKEVIVGAGEGGGPIVSILDFSTFRFSGSGFIPFGRVQFIAPQTTSFFAYDPNMRSGVRVTAGDINGPDQGFTPGVGTITSPGAGNNNDYVITAPGEGGAPHVKVFDIPNVRGRLVLNRPVDSVYSFYAGDGTNTTGIFVASGDVNGDGIDEIITGTAGQNFGIVRVFSPSGGLLNTINIPVDEIPTSGPIYGLYANTKGASGNLLAPGQAPNSLVSTTPGMGIILPGVIRGGIRVGTYDWDGDGIDEIITASGPGNTPRVRVLDVSQGNGNSVELANFLAYESTFLGGVNVNT